MNNVFEYDSDRLKDKVWPVGFFYFLNLDCIRFITNFLISLILNVIIDPLRDWFQKFFSFPIFSIFILLLVSFFNQNT